MRRFTAGVFLGVAIETALVVLSLRRIRRWIPF